MKTKKILLVFTGILLTFYALIQGGCNSKPDYLSYVSELRKDVFVGEKDNFCVTVYCGTKEEPALFDGVKNQTHPTLTFKVLQKEEVGAPISVKFKIANKEYCKDLEFNPVKSTLSCEVEVNALPEKNLIVQLVYGENETLIETKSKLNDKNISYIKALEISVNEGQSFLKEHTVKGVLKCEIVIRLLCENERNYYYVGFICEEGLKLAYLINGETGEIIAKKQN